MKNTLSVANLCSKLGKHDDGLKNHHRVPCFLPKLLCKLRDSYPLCLQYRTFYFTHEGFAWDNGHYHLTNHDDSCMEEIGSECMG